MPCGVNMDSNQDMSGNDKEHVSVGIGDTDGPKEEIVDHDSSEGKSNKDDPLYVQKRLKRERRNHEREIRELQARMDQMQSQLQPNQSMQQQPQQGPQDFGNPMQQQMQQQGAGNMDMIQQAVSYALQQKEMEERRARESEAQQHIVKQYQELNRHLDQTSDKYDDFDDIVRGDAPYTAHMRDAALMLPKKGPGSAGEVLYRLGKNPEELKRIGQLHPVEQAKELVALSHALISGGNEKQSQSKPLHSIKSNPVVNSVGITDKTPVSDIRNRMKQGTFK